MKLTLEKIAIIALICTNLSTGIFCIVFSNRLHKITKALNETQAIIDRAEIESKAIEADLKILEYRRHILDSLNKSNQKKRDHERIELIKNASDATIDSIIQRHLRAKRNGTFAK